MILEMLKQFWNCVASVLGRWKIPLNFRVYSFKMGGGQIVLGIFFGGEEVNFLLILELLT